MDSEEAPLNIISERIKERSNNINALAEQNKAKKLANLPPTENVDDFADKLSKMKEEIDEKLHHANLIDKNELSEYLNTLVEDVSVMQNFLNESSMFLASFTIKKSQEKIDVLNEKVQVCIQELQPKKRFGFRNRNTKPLPLQKTNQDTKDSLKHSSDSQKETKEFKNGTYFGFRDANGEILAKASDELQDKQLNLSYLTNCKVTALGNPSSLQFSHLQNTVVLVGPTSRSALIKHCSNCTFVLACQQVRIHDSENTNFYLHVTGAAIIENCKNLSFAPYTLQYENLNQDYAKSGLAKDINNWREIKDFLWFNDKEKSPNFKLLEESEWKYDWL